MRRGVWLLMLAAVSMPAAAVAGGVDVTVLGGWQFLGELDFDQGRTTIPADWAFGVILGFDVQSGGQVELVYQRQNTELHQQQGDNFGPTRKIFDMAMEYYHLGGLYEPKPHGNWQPIVVGSLGATHLNPQEENLSSEWRFSGALGGGVKWQKRGSRLALRAQSRVWATFFNSSTEIFCSSGSGTCFISIAGSILVQIDVSAGLTFTFGS